jgi:hypothetical protein
MTDSLLEQSIEHPLMLNAHRVIDLKDSIPDFIDGSAEAGVDHGFGRGADSKLLGRHEVSQSIVEIKYNSLNRPVSPGGHHTFPFAGAVL